MSTGTSKKSGSAKSGGTAKSGKKRNFQGGMIKDTRMASEGRTAGTSKAYAAVHTTPKPKPSRLVADRAGKAVAKHKPAPVARDFALVPTRAPGAMTLGVTAGTIDELINDIKHGLPTTSLGRLSESLGSPIKTILELTGISERTMARRQVSERLTQAESERTARIARVTERAQTMMGQQEGNRWLMSPWPALNHQTPLTYAQTDLGAEAVIDLMGALEEGIFV